MMKNTRIHALWAAILTLVLGAAFANAEVGPIRDTAAFFSDRAKSEAASRIAEMERRFKKSLVVETFQSVPEEMKQGLDTQDKAARTRLFEQWAEKQARQIKVNGVYILISKEPAHLHAVVGNDTQNRAFTRLDRDDLVSMMLARLRQKQNDEALREGVDFVLSTMARHAGTGNRARNAPASAVAAPAREHHTGGSSSWSWIIPVLIGVGVVWLVVGILRSLFRGGSTSGTGGMSPGFGGGGFLSSLLGGMFGAAAGMWLYDQFTSHGSSSAADSYDNGSGDTGFSGQDTDYSGSGGDFSDDSGGGGFGGDSGDSGGGDF